MNILAIETSCDETAASVVEISPRSGGGDAIRVRSNAISSQVALHEQYGGVVPALAAREHAANVGPVVEQALRDANQTAPVDLIAVTRGPGLAPALLVGLTFARTLAWKWSVPLVGVDHMDGHIHSNWLPPSEGDAQLPDFPLLNLVVSGGHTDLVLMRDHGTYEIIGETKDDAVGEAFDKVARLLGLSYPGGPKVSTLARAGDPARYTLPRPMLKADTFDFSYSGLKTAVLYLIRDITGSTRELTEQEKADIAASFQEAAVDVLVQKAIRAATQHQVRAILLSGGVSANTLLRQRLDVACRENNLQCVLPELRYTTDNAAMIAVAGYFAYAASGATPWEHLAMDANLRLGQNTTT
ncbi:MAG: tRNA (adenosine(37)-N6)-threonylcarbamoyltransferase complex transferase subunit TsaD [Candidatus Yanofskybacteria bacterium]|nr:tRNA (adenosine(37)-N6)-threonylcarbamoyltransferase complex transferase subunit TsaD [Candidatus Yanofskybacteria bacterium]